MPNWWQTDLVIFLIRLGAHYILGFLKIHIINSKWLFRQQIFSYKHPQQISLRISAADFNFFCGGFCRVSYLMGLICILFTDSISVQKLQWHATFFRSESVQNFLESRLQNPRRTSFSYRLDIICSFLCGFHGVFRFRWRMSAFRIWCGFKLVVS